MQVVTVKEALLGWIGPFVGKRCKKVWRMTPLCSFGLFGRKGIKGHYLKTSFLSILFSWVKMYIEIGSMSLFNFVEWLGSC